MVWFMKLPYFDGYEIQHPYITNWMGCGQDLQQDHKSLPVPPWQHAGKKTESSCCQSFGEVILYG